MFNLWSDVCVFYWSFSDVTLTPALNSLQGPNAFHKLVVKRIGCVYMFDVYSCICITGKFFTRALALYVEPDGFATSRGKLHQHYGEIEHEGHSLPTHKRHDTFKNSAHSLDTLSRDTF